MLDFVFHSPTYFQFGRDAELEVGNIVKMFHGSKILIHYGGGSVVKSGLLDRVKDVLTQNNIDFVELGGVKPNPRSGLIYEGIELCRNEKVDMILAVGGGSVIDSAKAIGIGVLYDGDFWDFYSKKAVAQASIPVGSILTIAAAGSEASFGSVVSNEDLDNLKRDTGSDCMKPLFCIMNPQLTTTLPAYQTACGITDMIAHILERYFTTSTDVSITDRIAEGLLLSIIETAPYLMENLTDYEARANIMWAGTQAHNNSCGVGRNHDWNSHNIEHELSSLYDVAHGAGLAVIMPAWMDFVMEYDIPRFVQFATRVWGCELDEAHPEKTAKEGIEAFRRFLRGIGMPLDFEELGAKEEDIDLLVQRHGVGDGVTWGLKPLTREDITQIYKIAAIKR
ncbi:MAG: iron-containing alcohol dehydrogenase [Erysipelotrichaceae bacterium]